MKYDSEKISKFVPEENEEERESISSKKIILAVIGFILIIIGLLSLNTEYTLKVLPGWVKSLLFGMIIVGGLLMSITFISWCLYPMRWGGKIH